MDLNRNDIDRLMKLAAAFAKKKLAKLPYIGADENDLAQSSFEHLVRSWHPAICTPEAYLCMRVKHEIDSILRRPQTFGVSSGYAENVVQLRDPQPLQEEEMEEKQRQEELLAYIKGKHTEAYTYASLIFFYDGTITRRQAADLLKVSPTHIDYLKKVLRGIMTQFLAEQSNSDSPAQRLLNK